MKHTDARPAGSRLEDWIEPLTLRGRWGRISSADKEFVEPDAVRDIAPSFAAEFGIELSSIERRHDPPDVSARLGNRFIAIELIELMNEAVREKTARKQPIDFDERLWSEAQLVSKLNRLLDKKDALYSRRPDQFKADALVIISCELWLNPTDVERWLSKATFEGRATIRSAYFAQERLPNFHKSHWPLFRLYGDLAVP